MGTQAVISAVYNGDVLYKIVAGCNGQEAVSIADELLANRVCSPRKALDVARNRKLGCEDCLILVTPDEIVSPDPVDARYVNTFSDPWNNPRWSIGTADYVRVIDFTTGKILENPTRQETESGV